MALLQFVTATQRGRPVEIEALQNPERRPFLAFENDQREALLWGSDDLISVGLRLRDEGFRAVECTLANTALDPLDDAFAEPTKAMLLASINGDEDAPSDGDLAALLSGVAVLALVLRRRKPRSETLRLMQNGQLELRSDEPDALIDLTVRIARELEKG